MEIEHQFAVCHQNDGYVASLERHKIYRVLPDDDAASHGYIRVVDESGEDYLYPENWFGAVALPQVVEEALFTA